LIHAPDVAWMLLQRWPLSALGYVARVADLRVGRHEAHVSRS